MKKNVLTDAQKFGNCLKVGSKVKVEKGDILPENAPAVYKLNTVEVAAEQIFALLRQDTFKYIDTNSGSPFKEAALIGKINGLRKAILAMGFPPRVIEREQFKGREAEADNWLELM